MNATTQRLFFGMPLDHAGRGALEQRAARLRSLSWGSAAEGSLTRGSLGGGPLPRAPRVRWTRPEGWHCTLKFLGSVRVELTELLLAKAAELDLAAGPPCYWQDIGAFPSLGRARILVAHLSDEAGHLARLAERLGELALTFDVPRETRAYRPHVTLARLERPFDIGAFREEFALGGPVTLGPVTLYASRPSPSGSHYEALWRASP